MKQLIEGIITPSGKEYFGNRKDNYVVNVLPDGRKFIDVWMMNLPQTVGTQTYVDGGKAVRVPEMLLAKSDKDNNYSKKVRVIFEELK